jgi:hypothetical protein
VAGEALRQVFAEFGFKVDDAPLEKMLADTERQIKLEESLSKVEKKVLGDVQRSAAEREKAKTAEAAEATKAAEVAAKAAEEERKAILDTIPGLRLLNSLKGSVRMRALGLAAGMGAVVAVAHRFAVAFAGDVAALRETADVARVTETQFQQLAFAGNAAGVGADVVTGSLNTLAEGLRAIEARTGGPTGALYRLGVQARNTDGTVRDTNDVLIDLADRFERVRNPVQRLRLAQELFGSNGRRMLTVLAGGSAALRRQREDFAALGGGVLPEAVEQGRRFTVAQGRMQVALDSVRSVIATSLLPVVTYLTNGIADVTGWFSRMTRGSNLVSVAIGAVGIAGAAAAVKIIAAWGPVLAPLAASALALGVILLVVDDIVTFLRGGNSVIGEFIDYLYGAGEAQQTLQYLPILWRDITEWIDAATAKVVGFLQSIGVMRTEVAAIGRLRPMSERMGPRPGAPPQEGPAGTATVAGRRGVRVTSVTPTVDRTPNAPTQPDYLRMLNYTPMATAPVRAGGGNRTTQVTTQNTFQITGITDPEAAARRVAVILEAQARRQRDEAHPQDAEE